MISVKTSLDNNNSDLCRLCNEVFLLFSVPHSYPLPIPLYPLFHSLSISHDLFLVYSLSLRVFTTLLIFPPSLSVSFYIYKSTYPNHTGFVVLFQSIRLFYILQSFFFYFELFSNKYIFTHITSCLFQKFSTPVVLTNLRNRKSKPTKTDDANHSFAHTNKKNQP